MDLEERARQEEIELSDEEDNMEAEELFQPFPLTKMETMESTEIVKQLLEEKQETRHSW